MKVLQYILDLLKSLFTKEVKEIIESREEKEPKKEANIKKASEKHIDPKPSMTKAEAIVSSYKKGKYSEEEIVILQRIVDAKLSDQALEKAIEKASKTLNRPAANLKSKIKKMKRS